MKLPCKKCGEEVERQIIPVKGAMCTRCKQKKQQAYSKKIRTESARDWYKRNRPAKTVSV